MYVVKELRKGLQSSFELKCKMCGITTTLLTENPEEGILNIKLAVTLACVSTGVGYAQLDELAAAINMPNMSDKTYCSYHEQVSDIICQTAWVTIEEAGKEEARLARDLGEVDKDQIPNITVITDGA
ncbi:hypothetical protein ILUMI_00950 [Ignelater luminosus]|uniref:Mutator-like transposase domain-containing protein n=1 Tax=Ignelater luminosus TaxID=2038154 RepID=A0A8K0DKY0_IGNLU|nr:hypothetical protein ILUMI_00950 [Ignelater luminosus]